MFQSVNIVEDCGVHRRERKRLKGEVGVRKALKIRNND